MKVKAKVNPNHLKYMKNVCIATLVETADALKSNLQQSQTMPFDSGNLQNRNTFVDASNKTSGIVKVVSDTPYARRLYYHPEYNFQKGKNANAGGMWFQPYVDGSKKDFVSKTFTKLLRGKL